MKIYILASTPLLLMESMGKDFVVAGTWLTKASTTFSRSLSSSGGGGKKEGDSSGGPVPDRELDHDWPTLVIESGVSQSVTELRTDIEQLTSGNLAPPKPDLYYGTSPEQLDRVVRDELYHHIIPSTAEDKPMAPNFFVEAKGPNGTAAVPLRQALFDGAVGARGMYSLQNYGEEEPVYDNNANTYSGTYYGGTLKLYDHYCTAPTTPGGQPEYRMTKLTGFDITDSCDTFIHSSAAPWSLSRFKHLSS